MGRHKLPTSERRVAITATLDPETLRLLDSMSQHEDVTRSVMIETALHWLFNSAYKGVIKE